MNRLLTYSEHSDPLMLSGSRNESENVVTMKAVVNGIWSFMTEANMLTEDSINE